MDLDELSGPCQLRPEWRSARDGTWLRGPEVLALGGPRNSSPRLSNSRSRKPSERHNPPRGSEGFSGASAGVSSRLLRGLCGAMRGSAGVRGSFQG